LISKPLKLLKSASRMRALRSFISFVNLNATGFSAVMSKKL